MAAPWADLPLDLLRDISRRLHTATDYVRFHGVCKPWHETLPPPPCRPGFLPWLLSPPDSTNCRRAICLFSSSRSSRRHGAAATETWVRDRRWVINLKDGTAASTLTTRPSSCDLDPLTGSAGAAPLPCLQTDDETMWWRDHAVGTVSGDGTISLYLIGRAYRTYYLPDMNVAIRRPGRASWTVVRKQNMSISSDRCCIAYHDGRIFVFDNWGSLTIKAMQAIQGDASINLRSWHIPHQSGKVVHSSYFLESGGDLLLGLVHVNHAHYYADYYRYSELDPDYHSVGRFVEGLLVSVYTMQHDVESGKLQWVERDDRSLVDRIMFLGHPTSFALDAAHFGDTSGGCAYFVIKNQLYGGIWSKSALERCRVFRYNFNNSKAELVKQLPAEWSDQACMWLTPQPSIALTEEIGGRHDPLDSKAGEPQFGPYFNIYVGNLPRKVDSSQLRQFFSKHGKVGDARVMCHIKTKRSRGFGFVTIATTIDDEPTHAIAKMDGLILHGRPLRVKFAD